MQSGRTPCRSRGSIHSKRFSDPSGRGRSSSLGSVVLNEPSFLKDESTPRSHEIGRNRVVATAGRRSGGHAGSCGYDPTSETRLMNTATPAIRDFARRLVALEAARAEPPVMSGNEAVRVCEKLRLPLSKLAGVAGFRSLMSRAVAMAKAEVPSLVAVRVGADGSLDGLDGP